MSGPVTPEDMRVLSDRVTRLEAYRDGDRERMKAFEAEMRSSHVSINIKLDAITNSLAQQTGSRAATDKVAEWLKFFLYSILGGCISWAVGHFK